MVTQPEALQEISDALKASRREAAGDEPAGAPAASTKPGKPGNAVPTKTGKNADQGGVAEGAALQNS